MRILLLALSTLLLWSCSSTGWIRTDNQSLREVATNMEAVKTEIQNGTYDKFEGHSILQRNGYRYSVSKYEDSFSIKVYEVGRFSPALNLCGLYFEYASEREGSRINIIKSVEGWDLVEDCRA